MAPVDGDGDGRDASQQRVPVRRRTADAATRWAVPVVVGHRPAGGGDDGEPDAVLLDGRVGRRSTLAGDGGLAGNANVGAHGFYRVRYTRDAAATRLLGRPRGADAARAVRAGRRHLGVGAGRHDRRRPTSWPWPSGSPTRPTCRCGSASSAASACSTACSTATRAAPCSPAGSATLVGPARAALGDEVRPDDDDRTRTLRGLLLGTAAAAGRRPDAARRCRRAAGPVPRRPGERRAEPGGPGAGGRGHPRRRGPARPPGRRRSGRGEPAGPRAGPAVAGPLPRPRGPAPHPGAERCPARSARRTPRTCCARPSPTATTAPRRGRSSPRHWDDAQRAVPGQQHRPAWSAASARIRDRALARRGVDVPGRAPGAPGRDAGPPAHRAHVRDGRPRGTRAGLTGRLRPRRPGRWSSRGPRGRCRPSWRSTWPGGT